MSRHVINLMALAISVGISAIIVVSTYPANHSDPGHIVLILPATMLAAPVVFPLVYLITGRFTEFLEDGPYDGGWDQGG